MTIKELKGLRALADDRSIAIKQSEKLSLLLSGEEGTT